MKFSRRDQALLANYGISPRQYPGIVVDSNMTHEQALGDDAVPAGSRDLHDKMKPFLRVVSVVYHGYDDRIHFGQIVVHEVVVGKINRLFRRMFELEFPIFSVIPQSQFGYDDQRSMAANNSSAYRPEQGSEHPYGATIDLNPMQNPFDRTRHRNPRPIEPAGAVYDVTAKGTIVMFGDVWRAWKKERFECGGGWGDPDAIPTTDFYQVGYFDYMHFQPDDTWYEVFKAQLPRGV